MKILQINVVYNSGSTGRIVANISDTSQKHGIESFVAFGRGNTSNLPLAVKKFGSKFDFYIHVLKTRLFDRHGYGSTRSTNKLIKEIEKLTPDIIHLHNIHGYYLNIEVLFKYFKLKNIPIVWTMHDCWAYTGHCAYYDYIACSKWKTACQKCPNSSSYPSSWFIDQSKQNFISKKKLFNYPNNMILIPVSKWLEKDLNNSFLVGYPKRVIHNGIDLNIFREYPTENICLKYHITNRKPIILGVANVWENRKGLNDFIKISTELHEYQIVLLGLNLKQISSLPEHIIGICRTENLEDMAKLYSLASVFVNPTYEDNFPTTNIEALACGTPVITYNTGGSPEAIDDETGYVVEKGNIEALVSTIKKVCTQGKDHYKIKCRKRAENLFNKDDRFNDYIELYKEILNKRDVTIQK